MLERRSRSDKMECPFCRKNCLYVDMYYCCTKCGRKYFNTEGYGFELRNKVSGDKL